MESTRLISAMFLFAVIVCIQLVSVNPEPVEKCLDGRYHKPSPSPEGPDYADCFSWKNKSCCTAEFTIELKKNRVENIWNFTWNHCGNLSKECERYIKDEECFFQCEPNLIKWHIGKAKIREVPICRSFCHDWFEACKYDKTCVADWGEFNYTSGSYICPLNSKCQTFAEVYGDGKGLCNKMWGSSFKQEESSNCMVMRFDGPGNPNDKVTKPVQLGSTLIPSVVITLLASSVSSFIF
ncbi:folate receptor gamma-like [Actinia tenebrosa]|uniref:Folate receptor gamma-like n=1 Tax=Actinia tenebrosa TaxID=6105 RepID=A0A6P8IER8_ACTTE|nr:folate receptor gamma-like [Actinia tenebrosa]